MNPITHLFTGWVLAEAGGMERRERTLVTLACVVPDLDGLGIVAEKLTAGSARPLLWWSDFHHVLAHNLFAGLLAAFAAFLIATHRRAAAGLLALTAFHLHLLEDLAGGKGPDGYDWPISYLYPFSETPRLAWSGQWAINAWPNFLITAVLLAAIFYLAWRRGRSPLEMVSSRADAAFVETLRRRVTGKAK